MDRFTNKVVIVTGAASGIGKASALRIAAEGGIVACLDVQEQALHDAVKEINANSATTGSASAYLCDIGNPQAITDAVAAVIKDHKKLNALCNIAGILKLQNTLEVNLEDWNQIIAVNLTGTFLMCQTALPHLIGTKGTIVNMASTAALGSHPWTAAYAASKGGILSMTKTFSIEFAKQGINANSLSPASVETPMSNNAKLPEGADYDLLKKILPLNGLVRPASDVASLVAFLASEDAVHINGVDVRIDGGMMT
tara:strand:- start:45 stop:806 length:762 start_codon:yes stop_codon:yes gene_type:complete